MSHYRNLGYRHIAFRKIVQRTLDIISGMI